MRFNKLSTPSYSEFIHKSRYARWIEGENRRENWGETVDRYMKYFHKEFLNDPIRARVRDAIFNLDVMPSMRALMSSGSAAEHSEIALYNCAYVACADTYVFSEIMYILMNGTGVGFSVERQYINQLPEKPKRYENAGIILVGDSKEGWATAYNSLIESLYKGIIPKFDVSEVRPKGSRLKVFGGRASGSEPLVELFDFTIGVFKASTGGKLTSIECHDIICKIANVVVAGGVRRCLPEGTPVNTSKGVVEIQDLSAGDEVVTGGKSHVVVAQEYTGLQPTITLKHTCGELVCTENHKVAVFNSDKGYIFKKAKDIVMNDCLVWDSLGYKGTTQWFDMYEIDAGIAWLIGLIHGDGYVHHGGVEITASAHEIRSLEKAQRIFNDVFGKSGKISKGHGECLRLRIHSVELGTLFSTIKTSNVDIRIPDIILNGMYREAYIAGLLDADGCVKKDGKIDVCTTVYKSFADNLQLALSTLGIGSLITFRSAEPRRLNGINAQDHYTVHIFGNTNRSNCLEKIAPYCETEKFKNYSVNFKSPYDFGFQHSLFEKRIQGYKSKGFVLLASKVMRGYESCYFPSKVTGIIHNTELVKTYDIQVKDVEQFTTGGIVVHNSALISLSNLTDHRMATAKSGEWYIDNPQRALANNSVNYTEKPTVSDFMTEFKNLYESKSGERGIFSSHVAKLSVPDRRKGYEGGYGCNPCLSKHMKLLTKNGFVEIGKLANTTFEIIGSDGSVSTTTAWSNGVKECVSINFEHNSRKSLEFTPDHLFMLNDGSECLAKDLKGKRLMPYCDVNELTVEESTKLKKESPLIVSVKPMGKHEVFDFEEPVTHWGIVEGFVAHNCSEIILRDTGQFCNLSEVIVRPEDTLDTLVDKVEIATIIGTAQSTKTNFKYIRQQWADNCNEERLLGVSLTGICDHEVMQNVSPKLANWLTVLKRQSIKTNIEHAKGAGINPSKSITCVKPSGCRPATALVTTKQGILTLGELMPCGGKEWTDIEGVSHGGNITKFYRNGDAEVFNINMDFGLTVQSTANHQWFINNEWKRTDEIIEGDVLTIETGCYTSTIDQPFEDIVQSIRTRIIQPTRLNPDISWLLGYLWGGGRLSETKHRIIFTDQHVTHLEKALNILNVHFGMSGSIKPISGDRDCSVLETGCRNLWEWLLENGLFKYQNDDKKLADIPKIIRMSSQESIIAFFAGLFDADGCFSTMKSQSNKCMLSCSQADFVQHAQQVAWTVGLALGRSHNTKGKVKSTLLMTLSNVNCTDEAKLLFTKHSIKFTGLLESTRLYKSGIVRSVESVGVMPTFDIETENHWFMAGSVKSHNTVSQLVDCASGIHPRYAPYYIRTVRSDNKDPLAHMMIHQGIPNEPCHMNPDTIIFSFPIKSPPDSVMRDDKTALEQLDMWMIYQTNWCEHKVSITVYVKEHEWMDVMAWVWDNFDKVSGISFLPHSDHSYKQAPYQEIDEETYHRLVKELPPIEWCKLPDFEKSDTTTPQAELACAGGACEIL